MTLIVETGAIVTGANSYISIANFQAYAAERGITIVGDEEELLVQAMDYLETLVYKGLRITRDQPLLMPRSGIVYDGYEVLYNTIHLKIVDAQCEVALAIDAGNGPLADIARSTKREKVGPLEVEYMDSASSVVTNRKIMSLLTPFLASGTSGWNFMIGKS